MILSAVPPVFAQPRPNLILVTVDTLRADHVSVYDPESPAPTPALDALAADGVWFEDVSTTNPLTTPAHASLLTGTFPPHHGVRDFTGYRLADEEVTLAETLRQVGYATAGFVAAAVLDHRTGMAQGFDTYGDGFESFLDRDSTVAERPGSEVLAQARGWLQAAPRPFFVWIHLYEPHDPYTPPEPYRSRHAEDPYAGEVAYTDALLGEFFRFLRAQRLWDSSLITVASDHGEGLGEHGESRHGFFLYQSTMRVPWILRLPGGEFRGTHIVEPASLADVFPTLLHGLGVDRSQWPERLQGQSRYGLIRGTRSGGGAIYLESLTPQYQFGWAGLQAWRQGRYKFILAPRPELYDLEADADERNNLVAEQQSLASRLRRQLEQFEESFDQPRVVSQAADPQLQEQLRSLGYVGVAGASGNPADDAPDPKDKIEVYETMQRGVEAARGRQWGTAIRELSKAAEAEPESPAIVTSLALAYRDSGNREQAIRWMDRALSLTPSDSALRLEHARYLIAIGMEERARKELQAILARDPQNFLALFNLGTLEGQQGNLKQAADYFQRAVAVKEDAGALVSLALAESYLGRLETAEKHLKRALELEPENRRAHIQLAEVYERTGRHEEAVRHRRLAQP